MRLQANQPVAVMAEAIEDQADVAEPVQTESDLSQSDQELSYLAEADQTESGLIEADQAQAEANEAAPAQERALQAQIVRIFPRSSHESSMYMHEKKEVTLQPETIQYYRRMIGKARMRSRRNQMRLNVSMWEASTMLFSFRL